MVKKGIVLSISLAYLSANFMAQPVAQIKPAMQLESEKVPGGMGVSVVWNPGIKTYYAAISGSGEKWLLLS